MRLRLQQRAAAVQAVRVTRVQAEEYIERSGLSAVMKDAVLLLLENRCVTDLRRQLHPSEII